MEHITRGAIGRILVGDAGINRIQRSKGYIKTLCFMDENERFIDIHVTEEQVSDLIKTLISELQVGLIGKILRITLKIKIIKL